VFFPLFMTAKALLSPTAFGATGAVLDETGRVLLVRHRYMKGWGLPGGGVARNEPPHLAVMRELGEEVGLSGGEATLFGLYTRGAGWVTNVVAFYRITGATVAFTPNLEISAVCFADPADPPPETVASARRRLQELTGAVPPSPYW
jgi:8-oxo-dGTP pyrophosphatase MutT (NUDIX family)